jgi:hypothetical protein
VNSVDTTVCQFRSADVRRAHTTSVNTNIKVTKIIKAKGIIILTLCMLLSCKIALSASISELLNSGRCPAGHSSP